MTTDHAQDTSLTLGRAWARVPKPAKQLGILVIATAVFSAVFHPMVFIFDTYDYLFRSFHLLAYGSHPFGFGLLLRILAALAHPLWTGALSHLFTAWQLCCIAVLGVACLQGRQPLQRPQRWQEALPLATLGVVTIVFFGAPMLYLTNGYLSEVTAFALLAWSASAFARAAEQPGSVRRWLWFGLVCVVGYHVRYQHMVVPLAAGLTVFVRFVLRKIRFRELARRALPIAAVIGAIPLSQACLAQSAEVDEYGLRHHEVFLRRSIQCSLGCSVRMFETSCQSDHGRRLVENTPCWRLILVPEHELGAPYPSPAGVLGTLLSLDAQTLLDFILKAPVGYLQQMQDGPFHLVGFSFDRNVDWFSEHAPQVVNHYAQYFSESPAKASPAFHAVLDYLRNRYADWWYHRLTAGSVFFACVALFLTRDWAAGCFYATTIGTFFLMSYLQPQFPLRYSMHIALPALLGAYRDVLGLISAHSKRKESMSTFATQETGS